ncbi:L-threonylcarbamoyladenylate synthase [Legionella sp. W05-934-2]|jgi:L-threonylcarbamoyladenylate synthase|uniref:L-threonylcarbamoyladenylate synthase n=1 Tax=Legionella sp. W05-934-2 TaxID=1198649 RepID=UPI003461F43F
MSHITTNIQSAIENLRLGHPVALPTETVYGLAANAQNESAIRAVFTLKNRPLDHPLILHVAPEWDLTQWITDIPDYAKKLMDAFWPGPLTFVLNCDESKIPALVRGGQASVAVRSPNHPVFLACLRQFGSPLVAPSANPYGKVSPTTAEHVADSFTNASLLIVDGGRCEIGIESTIIDARKDNGFQILRHGHIKETDINQVVAIATLKSDNPLRVSGRLNDHYQPQKPLFTFETDEQRQVLLAKHNPLLYLIDYENPGLIEPTLFFKWPQSAEQAAYELYYQLRVADKSKALAIAIRLPPLDANWSAVYERILKASQK